MATSAIHHGLQFADPIVHHVMPDHEGAQKRRYGKESRAPLSKTLLLNKQKKKRSWMSAILKLK